jgi:hypothetical protein
VALSPQYTLIKQCNHQVVLLKELVVAKTINSNQKPKHHLTFVLQQSLQRQTKPKIWPRLQDMPEINMLFPGSSI